MVKFLAKLASDYNKPNGLTVIRPEEAQQFLDDLPINLNGYSVNIYLNTDVAENIELRGHYAGLVNIFLCGYNLKGTIRGNFNNSAYGIYGGNSESATTNLGAIMPYEGYKIGSYYYSVSMVNCPNVTIKNVTIYGGSTNGKRKNNRISGRIS